MSQTLFTPGRRGSIQERIERGLQSGAAETSNNQAASAQTMSGNAASSQKGSLRDRINRGLQIQEFETPEPRSRSRTSAGGTEHSRPGSGNGLLLGNMAAISAATQPLHQNLNREIAAGGIRPGFSSGVGRGGGFGDGGGGFNAETPVKDKSEFAEYEERMSQKTGIPALDAVIGAVDAVTDIPTVKNAVLGGMAQVNNAAANTLNLVPSVVSDVLGVENDFPTQRLADYTKETADAFTQQAQESASRYGSGGEVMANLLSGTMSAVPSAVLSILSGGTSAITQLAPQASGVASTLYNGIQTAAQNPMFWSSFINTVGNEYESAMERGANPGEALVSALGASLVNSGIEVGGGIETLPDALRTGDTSRWLSVLRSGAEEAGEEVAQDIVSGAVQKSIFDQDRPAFSMTDEDAVINPLRSAETAAMAFGSSALLGAGQNLALGALDSGQRQQEQQESIVQPNVENEELRVLRGIQEETQPELTIQEEQAETGQTVPAEIQQQTEQQTAETMVPETQYQQEEHESSAPRIERQQFGEAEAAENINQVRRAAAALGENGSRALTAAYNEDVARTYSPVDVVRGFYWAYNSALDGSSMTEAQEAAVNILPPQIRFAAESSAQQDRVRAEQSAYFGENAGLVRDSAMRRAALSTQDARRLDALAKTLGVEIRFANTVEDSAGRSANAKYENGRITVSLQAQDPVMTSVIHEVIHRIRESSPDAYTELADFVRSTLSTEELQSALDVRGRLYNTGDVDFSSEELVADAFGRVVRGETLDAFAREHRNLAQRVLDAVRDILSSIRRALSGRNITLTDAQKREFQSLYDRMRETEQRFLDALDMAGSAQQNSTAQTDGAARYSINDQFSRDIQDWYQEGQPEGEQFVLGSTGPVLQGLGAIESDIYMNGDKISTILREHPEMSIQEIQRIPEILEDPVLVLKSRNAGRGGQQNTRMVVFGTVRAQNGKPVMAVLDLQPRESGLVIDDMQKVNSAYTRNNGANFVRNSDVMYADEKRTIPLLRRLGLTIASRELLQDDSVGSIADEQVTVNTDRSQGDSSSSRLAHTGPEGLLRSGYIGSISYSGKSVNLNGVPFSSVVSKTGGDSNVRYSLQYDRDNNPYVVVEEDILDGVPRNEWVKTVKDNLRRKFPNGVTVGNNVIEINKQSRMEMTFSRYMQRLMKNDRQIFADKLRATNNADEIVQAARNWVNEALLHPRKDAIIDFARGEVLMRIGRNDYAAQVIVGNRENSGLLLYDVINLSPVSIQERIKKSGAEFTGQPHEAGRTVDSSTPTQSAAPASDVNSIPESGGDVNGRYSLSDREVLDQYVEQYGAIPKGERPAREITMPRKTGERQNLSQTVRTILEARATPEGIVQNIEKLAADGTLSYNPYSDREAMTDAENTVREKGWDRAQRDWFEDVKSGKVSKESTAIGWTLYNQAANSGNTELAMDVLVNMVEHQRSAAQAVQASRILKKMTPEGQLYGVVRSVNNLMAEIRSKHGGKYKDIKIDPDLAERFLQARTEEARDEALRDLYRNIGEQVPSTLLDKWNAWRYMAMLTNPRTHIRNVAGNAGFQPVRLIKNEIAAGIETALSLAGANIERTKSFAASPALYRAAWGDFRNMAAVLTGSQLQNDASTINQYRRVFSSKVLEGIRQFNTSVLDAEDMVFKRITYADSLAGYLQANGVNAQQFAEGNVDAALLRRARDYAAQEALKATYQDRNVFSDRINRVAKAAGPVGDAVLPFRRTPANILVRGMEYSPFGIARSIWDSAVNLRSGKATVAQVIDEFSAGLTGTGLLALGAYLFASGLVTGSDDDEWDDLTGHQQYALEIGNKSFTIDWLAPQSIPFFMGVELASSMGENGMAFEAFLNAMQSVSNPILELSMLQSLNDIIASASYAQNAPLQEIIPETIISYLTQGLPTVLGQVERTGQDVRMTTYTDKNSQIPTDIQYALGAASSRIPGWDYQQIPYIDAWGRTEATGNAAERAFDNFLNPAYRSTIQTSPMEEELERLKDQTGDDGVLPERAPKFIEYNGERKELTADEYVDFATQRGKTAYQILTSLTGSEAYQNAPDETKVEMVKDAYEYADQTAKAAVSDYQPSSWVLKADATKDENLSTGESIAQYIQKQHRVSSEKTENKTSSFSASDLSADVMAQYNDRWAESYGDTVSMLEENRRFDSLDDSVKEKALASAEDLAKDYALAELSDGAYRVTTQWMNWATGGAQYGVDESEAILFKTAYDMAVGDQDEEGNTISGSKKENTLELARTMLPGLTDRELEYLMANYWTPEDETLKAMQERKFQ